MTATLISFFLGLHAGKLIARRRGSVLELVSTIGGVGLFTAFMPWLALMLIWLFALTPGCLPVGKILDPVVWQGAEVGTNRIFYGLMIAGAGVISVEAAAHLAIQRMSRISGWLPWLAMAAAVAVALGAWAAQGTGFLVQTHCENYVDLRFGTSHEPRRRMGQSGPIRKRPACVGAASEGHH